MINRLLAVPLFPIPSSETSSCSNIAVLSHPSAVDRFACSSMSMLPPLVHVFGINMRDIKYDSHKGCCLKCLDDIG